MTHLPAFGPERCRHIHDRKLLIKSICFISLQANNSGIRQWCESISSHIVVVVIPIPSCLFTFCSLFLLFLTRCWQIDPNLLPWFINLPSRCVYLFKKSVSDVVTEWSIERERESKRKNLGRTNSFWPFIVCSYWGCSRGSGRRFAMQQSKSKPSAKTPVLWHFH